MTTRQRNQRARLTERNERVKKMYAKIQSEKPKWRRAEWVKEVVRQMNFAISEGTVDKILTGYYDRLWEDTPTNQLNIF